MIFKKSIVKVLCVLSVLSVLQSCSWPVKPAAVKETHNKKVVYPKIDNQGKPAVESHEIYEEYHYGC